MKLVKCPTFFLVATSLLTVLGRTNLAQAFQQDFPTGEAGYGVSFSVSDTPGSRSGCVVAISAGLPTMGLSISLFRDDK
jgi:hypothetical protein